MTELYYHETQAEDLRTGDLFLHWAVMKDGLYPEPRRIIEMRKVKKNLLKAILEDGQSYDLAPEMVVVVGEFA